MKKKIYGSAILWFFTSETCGVSFDILHENIIVLLESPADTATHTPR